MSEKDDSALTFGEANTAPSLVKGASCERALLALLAAFVDCDKPGAEIRAAWAKVGRDMGLTAGQEPPSIVERFLVRKARECLSTVAYAEANADDWAGALLASDRDRLRRDAQMLQLAADYLCTQGQELTALRSGATPKPF